MELFRERTNEELFELLGVRNEPVELPKSKITLGDLEQKNIDYLYNKLCKGSIPTESDVELVKIIFENR